MTSKNILRHSWFFCNLTKTIQPSQSHSLSKDLPKVKFIVKDSKFVKKHFSLILHHFRALYGSICCTKRPIWPRINFRIGPRPEAARASHRATRPPFLGHCPLPSPTPSTQPRRQVPPGPKTVLEPEEAPPQSCIAARPNWRQVTTLGLRPQPRPRILPRDFSSLKTIRSTAITMTMQI